MTCRLSRNQALRAAQPDSRTSVPDAGIPKTSEAEAAGSALDPAALFVSIGGTPSLVHAELPADRTARTPTAPAAPVMPAASNPGEVAL